MASSPTPPPNAPEHIAVPPRYTAPPVLTDEQLVAHAEAMAAVLASRLSLTSAPERITTVEHEQIVVPPPPAVRSEWPRTPHPNQRG